MSDREVRGPWIKSYAELADHSKLIECSSLLSVSMPTLAGHLHYLWWWTLRYAEEGVIPGTDEVAEMLVCHAARWEGDEVEFVDALVETEFLEWRLHTRNDSCTGAGHEDVQAGGRSPCNDCCCTYELVVHGWQEHHGSFLDKMRKRRQRNGHNGSALHENLSRDSTDVEVDGEPGVQLCAGELSPEAEKAFETWWEGVPRKRNRFRALPAFDEALRRCGWSGDDSDVAGLAQAVETLVAARDRWAEEAAGVEPRFVLHPARWLNEDRWTDEREDPRAAERKREEKKRNRERAEVERKHDHLEGVIRESGPRPDLVATFNRYRERLGFEPKQFEAWEPPAELSGAIKRATKGVTNG